MRRKWPVAIAEVTECHYDVRAGRVLAFGLTSSKHFRIAYHYRVGDELRKGECFSETARLRGSLFEIHYDPDLPDFSHSSGTLRPFLLVIAIAGSIALLLMFLGLRGC